VTQLDAVVTVAHHLREAAEAASMVARLTRDLPRFLRKPMTLDEAQSHVRRQIESRDERFLRLAERAIFRHAQSPYLALLRHAGCELGDLRAMVASEGLEGALAVLAERDVYVTYDEFKGRREIRRGSFRLVAQQDRFANPLVTPHLILLTGGSGRQQSRIRYSLGYFREMAATTALINAAHGLHEPGVVHWWPAPLPHMLMFAMVGVPSVRWFYPVALPAVARLLASYVSLVTRFSGVTLPPAESCDLAEPEAIARWLAAKLKARPPLILKCTTTGALRVATFANDAGLDLTGLAFLPSGEPLTEIRRQQMERTGARIIDSYSSIDVSAPSYSCGDPGATTDLHTMTHRFALVSRPRETVPGGPTVDALLVSSIDETIPNIALNTEIGDYAKLDQHQCSCLLGELGMRTFVSEIGSFEKLTGEGVTFARSNLQTVLDRVLPARFGGSGLDYQLAEEERPDGATVLILRVSPSVGPIDEDALRTTFLAEIGRDTMIDEYQAAMWRQAGSVQVRREAPAATPAGKVLPLQLRRYPAPTGVSSPR
jgi:hypothetical protein